MKRTTTLASAAIAVSLLSIQPAGAETVKIGAILSITGPAAALGTPSRNTVQLLPKKIGNTDVQWIVLDDASDTTTAVKNVRKLLSEDKVDVIVGSNTTPNSLAVTDTVYEARTPLISLAGVATIVEPVDEKRRWVFKTPPLNRDVVSIILDDFKARGFKTLASVVSDDGFGDGFAKDLEIQAERAGIPIVARERFNNKDTSAAGQALKIIGAKPDAVFVASLGTSTVLPQAALRQRGYKGQFYTTYAASSPEYLQVGGKNVEGTILPVGPILVADQLSASSPIRETANAYVREYEGKYGRNSRSTHGAHTYDAWLLIADAVPRALEKARPGTPEFRAALRDAIETTKNVPGTHGVFNLGPQDHVGLDKTALVPVRVEAGNWKLLPAPAAGK